LNRFYFLYVYQFITKQRYLGSYFTGRTVVLADAVPVYKCSIYFSKFSAATSLEHRSIWFDQTITTDLTDFNSRKQLRF